MNLNGRLRTTPRGFEDRGLRVRTGPLGSARVRPWRLWFHARPRTAAVVRRVGCHLGCQFGALPCRTTRRLPSACLEFVAVCQW